MTDYREGSIGDHADLQEPPPTVGMLCRCGFDGQGSVIQKAPGIIASIQGPAEPPTLAIVCPKCRAEYDPEDAEVRIDFEPDPVADKKGEADRKIAEAARILHHYHTSPAVRVGACDDAAAEILSACELIAEAGAALAVAYLANEEKA